MQIQSNKYIHERKRIILNQKKKKTVADEIQTDLHKSTS